MSLQVLGLEIGIPKAVTSATPKTHIPRNPEVLDPSSGSLLQGPGNRTSQTGKKQYTCVFSFALLCIFMCMLVIHICICIIHALGSL